MPPTSVTLQHTKKMFQEVRELTENFKKIKPELLENDASRVLILRLVLEMSQNEFENFLGVVNKNISKYERGKIKKMNKETSKKYIDKISPKLTNKNISETKIIQAYEKMRKESNGFLKAHQGTRKVLLAQRKGAINSLRKRYTQQEKSLTELLEAKGFSPVINFPLSEEKGIITDIFLEKENTAIECKDIISKNHREFKEQIRLLAYQGYRIKFNFPDIKIVAVVKSNFKLSHRDMDELKGPYDHILADVGELKNITFS